MKISYDRKMTTKEIFRVANNESLEVPSENMYALLERMYFAGYAVGLEDAMKEVKPRMPDYSFDPLP